MKEIAKQVDELKMKIECFFIDRRFYTMTDLLDKMITCDRYSEKITVTIKIQLGKCLKY